MFDEKKDTGRFLNRFVSKKNRKLIGWTLILLGIAMALPPVIPTPDDFLNLILAKELVGAGLATETALIATYTIIPFTLFTTGVYVFPAKDGTIYKKSKRLFLKTLKSYLQSIKNPIIFITSVAIIWLMYNYYLEMLETTGMI